MRFHVHVYGQTQVFRLKTSLRGAFSSTHPEEHLLLLLFLGNRGQTQARFGGALRPQT